MNIEERIKMIPLKWAKDAQFWYQNENGCCWIAWLVENQLMVSGGDVQWKPITLTIKEVKHYRRSLQKEKLALFENNVLSDGEKYWVLALFESALYHFEKHKAKSQNY